MEAKKRKHRISISVPISDAMQALANLEGKDVSELYLRAAEALLEREGRLPKPTPEAFEAELDRVKKSGK